jgi:signal peptidase I
LITGCIAVGLLALIRTRFELALTVGNSMAPTLCNGDLLVIDKQAYESAEPKREDIVLAHYRGELVVKRVVGLPHEDVELKKGTLCVNGSVVPEHYLLDPDHLNIDRGMLCDNRFALLGDNRAVPPSVLTHGVVGQEQIIGKARLIIRLWPFRVSTATHSRAPDNLLSDKLSWGHPTPSLLFRTASSLQQRIRSRSGLDQVSIRSRWGFDECSVWFRSGDVHLLVRSW